MTATPARTPRRPLRGVRAGALGRRVAGAVLLVAVALLLSAGPASAHVVPSSVLQLDLHADRVDGDLLVPATDLATASGLPLVGQDGAGAPVDAETADAVAGYLTDNVAVTSDAGDWEVRVSDVATTTTEQYGTGTFPAVTADVVLVPPAGADVHRFELDYDAVVHQVVTADAYVVLRSDDTGAVVAGDLPASLGTVTVDTVTGTIPALQVDLTADTGGGSRAGFPEMVALGVSHVAEGTDHQLFLLTLLLPAPLLAAAGRWRATVPARRTVRRITGTTLAFTLGHSATLALGALGLPVPGRAVEAAIAVSILVAAAHAVRPLFPGREPLVAGVFGLVHGLAFAGTLSGLDLSGGELVRGLLGFNVGIELAQLAVVLLVLPPLVVLARTPAHRRLRVAAAVLTGVAATGWLLDRVGVDTPLAGAADRLGPASPWLAGLLWVTAVVVLARARTGSVPPPAPVGGHDVPLAGSAR
ncbi:HupE / UreJ protein [Geodermatophilus telluris]|uniref:HupE / UreJ protein n=1 Tax=Geodermatophilus telluris TaxID=1190417 RepID=A0A1G6TK68_9ACTN|nr:HupE/UreJ family protein [Geodermatophilus telluris]SDD29264.1 HupE / UreJ protein [Geodermatophilus telluris]